jgi:hypothetical protein
VSWLEAGFLALTSYFLVGMSGGPAEFFIFLVLFLLLALTGSAIGRCLAYALPTGKCNCNSCQSVAGITFDSVTAGFLFS